MQPKHLLGAGACALLLAGTLVAGCSPAPHAGHENGHAPATADAAGEDVQAAGVVVDGAWIRQPPPGGQVAAGYLRIGNGTQEADRLLAVETDAAGHVEIHGMFEEDGVMRMRRLEDGLEVPASGQVLLEPGGYHLMLMEPGEGLEAGSQVEARLVFAHAGGVEVVFDVRTPAGEAVGDEDGHHGHHH